MFCATFLDNAAEQANAEQIPDFTKHGNLSGNATDHMPKGPGAGGKGAGGRRAGGPSGGAMGAMPQGIPPELIMFFMQYGTILTMGMVAMTLMLTVIILIIACCVCCRQCKRSRTYRLRQNSSNYPMHANGNSKASNI